MAVNDLPFAVLPAIRVRDTEVVRLDRTAVTRHHGVLVADRVGQIAPSDSPDAIPSVSSTSSRGSYVGGFECRPTRCFSSPTAIHPSGSLPDSDREPHAKEKAPGHGSGEHDEGDRPGQVRLT